METPDLFTHDDAATPRPVGSTGIPTIVCKCCGAELPVNQFYSNGKTYYKRCKSCMTSARKLTKLYNQCSMTPVAQWPKPLTDLTEMFMAYQAAGGKIDYAGDSVMEAIERFKLVGSDEIANQQELIEQYGLEEALSIALNRIACLEHNYGLLHESVDKLTKSIEQAKDKVTKLKAKNSMDEVNAKQQRRRRDLLNKINSDALLHQVYTPTELNDLVQCFKDAYSAISNYGYLPATELWHLVALLEVKQQPLTLDMEAFYEEFLKPGIEAAKEQEEYGLMQGDVVDHVYGDYYELDWRGIPYNFE